MASRHLITVAGDVVTEVTVGRGVAVDGSQVVPEGVEGRRVAILTQPATGATARRLAGSLAGAGLGTSVEVLPDGEAAKALAVVEAVYRRLNELELSRHDLVVGVGGGALTDVAGFVAATYLRGVELVLVPTTLLGAVDAAIGGKTAVNVDGKNLAGAFHHPVRVLVDLDVLDLLPAELRRQGSAEAVKAGLVGDPALVDLYERWGPDAPLDDVVNRAIAVKVAVVSADPTERGRRAWLNYGHTVGHAIEVVGSLSHGDAVAVGMVAAGEASTLECGFREAERVVAVLRRLELPVAAPGLDPGEVRRLVALDKKRDLRGLQMTLLRAVGDPVVTPVGPATVDAALTAVGIR
ncbi:MAG TPA: 3-dehydroquinate synthase family protein [Acidimicrobiia bacterium]